MKKCPKCNEELYLVSEISKLICKNKECDYQCTISLEKEKNEIFKNNYLQYTWVIAESYSKLKCFYEKEQLYGLLFQIKDTFELLLKLPILIIIDRIITEKFNENQEIDKLLNYFFSKNLSLGDWEKIGNEIIRVSTDVLDVLNVEKELFEILESLLKLYDDNKIVSWRNTNIGHGVLKNPNDPELKADIDEKVKLIITYFEKFEDFYLKFKIAYKEEDKYINLEGINPNLKNLKETEKIYIYINKTYIKLNYLLFLKDKSIYLFDSYDSERNRLVISNYILGGRDSYSCEVIKKIYTQQKKRNAIFYMDDSPWSGEKVYIEEQEKIFQSKNEEENLERPEYLNKWLYNFIENKKKGKLMLAMQRGLGKTTFVKLLDPVSKKNFKELNNKAQVITYYINNTYSYDISVFRNTIIEKLRTIKGNTFGGAYKRFGEKNFPSRKEEFAFLLKWYKDMYKKKFGKDKLLLVIDGLDEIEITNNEESILDFIPEKELLDDGIYILLTTRNEKDIPNRFQIDSIEVDERKDISTNTQEYLDTVKNFLKKKCKITDVKEIQRMMNSSSNIFLYVRPVEILHRFNLDVSNIKNENDILSKFLHLLNELYGDKYFKELLDLLLVITISRKGINLEELLYMLNYNGFNFKILAYLDDIKSLLLIERSIDGNILQINHTTFRRYLIESYRENIESLIVRELEIITTTDNIVNVLSTSNNDGQYYSLCNSIYLADNYKKNYKSEVANKIIEADLQKVSSDKLNPKKLNMFLNLLNDLIGYLNVDNSNENLNRKNKENLVDIYMKELLIGINHNINYYIDYEFIFDKIERILKKYKLSDYYWVNFYHFRSIYYRRTGNIEGMEKDLVILENIKAYENDINFIIQEKMKLSIILKNQGEFEKSLEVSWEVLKLLTQDSKNDDQKKWEREMFNHIGLCYKHLKLFDRAKYWFKKSLESLENFKSEPSYYYSFRYKTMANFGSCIRESGEILQSESYYNETLKELKEYKQKEKLKVVIGESLLYSNLATVYMDRGELKDALIFCDKALQLEKATELCDDSLVKHIEFKKQQINSILKK